MYMTICQRFSPVALTPLFSNLFKKPFSLSCSEKLNCHHSVMNSGANTSEKFFKCCFTFSPKDDGFVIETGVEH